MRKITIFIIVLILILGVFFVTKNSMTGNIITGTITGSTINIKMAEKVLLETNHGDITIKLYDEMPITAGNFKKLVEQGFYDKVIFHRIIDGFMLQGGGFTSSGPKDSENIQDEFVSGFSNTRGTISMANTGQPNSGGSQFFINLVDNSQLDYDKQPLTSKHPVFGKVVEGMDIVDKIAKIQTDGNPPQGNNKPLEDVVIVKASLI